MLSSAHPISCVVAVSDVPPRILIEPFANQLSPKSCVEELCRIVSIKLRSFVPLGFVCLDAITLVLVKELRRIIALPHTRWNDQSHQVSHAASKPGESSRCRKSAYFRHSSCNPSGCGSFAAWLLYRTSACFPLALWRGDKGRKAVQHPISGALHSRTNLTSLPKLFENVWWCCLCFSKRF